jgi:hypothetical protein
MGEDLPVEIGSGLIPQDEADAAEYLFGMARK